MRTTLHEFARNQSLFTKNQYLSRLSSDAGRVRTAAYMIYQ